MNMKRYSTPTLLVRNWKLVNQVICASPMMGTEGYETVIEGEW